MRRALLIGLFAATVAVPARAQGGWRFEAGATAFRPEQRVRHTGGTEVQSGFWFGGEGALYRGAVRLGIVGLFGRLDASAGGTAPQANVRLSAISVAGKATEWLSVHAEAEARRHASGGVTTVWRLVGGGAMVTTEMGLTGLRGGIGASYYPVATTSVGPSMTLALRGAAEVSYAPPGGVLAYRVAYRFERYDFRANATGAVRLEQVRGLEIGMRVRLGR